MVFLHLGIAWGSTQEITQLNGIDVSSEKSEKWLLRKFTFLSNNMNDNNQPSKSKSKPKKNTVAYYQCMSACCQQGISPKKITQIAHECKQNSLGILAQRTSEIQKLNEAYRQIGESLTNLLQPVQEE